MSVVVWIAVAFVIRSVISIIVLWNTKDNDRATRYLALGLVGIAFDFAYTAYHFLKDYRSRKLSQHKAVFEPKDGFNFTNNQ
jgi:amino acid permease